jgi:hypothetical protein
MVVLAAQEVKALLVEIRLFLQYQQPLEAATVEMVLLELEVLLAVLVGQEVAVLVILLIVLYTMVVLVLLDRGLPVDTASILVDLTQAVVEVEALAE